VDPSRFVATLPSHWHDFPRSETPRDPRFGEILERVPGLACANNLALLNIAASLLDAGETYVEVGSFRGTSLIAAMLDNEQPQFVAVDDFSFREAKRATLERNLAAFGLLSRVRIVEGDAFEILRDGTLPDAIGVYYYDAAHTYRQQLEGLRLAEPFLADRALLIVDDTDWDYVAAATADYLRAQPHAHLILEIGGKDKGAPQWWEGVQVLAWAR
jgi:predicted O-methyltransferase YrrM